MPRALPQTSLDHRPHATPTAPAATPARPPPGFGSATRRAVHGCDARNARRTRASRTVAPHLAARDTRRTCAGLASPAETSPTQARPGYRAPTQLATDPDDEPM